MAYIYKIVNDINDKVYVGKTEFSLDKRFHEHCRDADKRDKEQRPLYAAMKKYGIEHFRIEMIEETDNPVEREIYWIEKFEGYTKGYNATIGGDGTKYIDYDAVVALYQEVQNQSEVARQMNICADSVKHILTERGIEIRTCEDISREQNLKIIEMRFPNQEEVLETFTNYTEAARYVYRNGYSTSKRVDGIAVHIRDVCLGKRKSAYGFHWSIKN